jgi:DNA modification methylase
VSAVILRGDAACLPMADASVDLICTSPPYWGQRSYTDNGEHYDGQIGDEPTPGEYIANLLACTREWVRVLKPQGSIFINLGDKYATRYSSVRGAGRAGLNDDDGSRGRSGQNRTGVSEKSLLGLPWRYALGCVDDLGLILRAEVVWQKPNGLPESVQDRVRRSHEQVFHFTKQPRYFAAVDEVREPHIKQNFGNRSSYAPGSSSGYVDGKRPPKSDAGLPLNPLGKLPGSVWEIPSQPLTVPAHLGVDHFAAFPMELPRRIILGWSPSGICAECGEGRRPVSVREQPANDRIRIGLAAEGRTRRLGATSGLRTNATAGEYPPATITGYACACPQPDAPVRSAVVLDPFAGTGTTMLVASAYGRIGIGVDRSADYCRLASWRCSDPGERARALGVPKPPPVPEGQGSLFDGIEDGEAS